MSYIKTKEDVALLRESGQLMGKILEDVAAMVAPGMSMADIDAAAESMIIEVGGIPAFKGYAPPGMRAYPATICASVNSEVVHGIPTKEKVAKTGDVVSIDIGMEWPAKSRSGRTVFTDTAVTVAAGKISADEKKLVNVTRQALEEGIKACVVGNSVADIGRAIESYVKSCGNYGIVRDLCGHGVGHAIHEDPYVFNYYDRSLESWKLEEGVVLALEPMITLGTHRVRTEKDGWTIATTDKSTCVHFEHTVVITKDGPLVVTRRPHEV